MSEFQFEREGQSEEATVRSTGYSRYATFLERVGAIFIDAVLLNILLFIALFAVFTVKESTEVPQSILTSLMLLISWLYFALCEGSSMMGTPGKRALKLVVTDSNGEQLTFLWAMLRFLARIILPLTAFIGYALIMLMPKQRALHDIMVNTLVWKR